MKFLVSKYYCEVKWKICLETRKNAINLVVFLKDEKLWNISFIGTKLFQAVAITLVAAVSAEADADAYYAPYFAPYAYGAYTFGGKSAPCVNAANVPVPCAGAPYAYHGYPYAAHYYGKRSADAEPEADADAYYGYYGYGAYRPYGYYGYRAYGYGYPYRYYGKRSADAEADADPALFYNTYGYGAFGAYPYGLAAYGGYGVLPYGGIAATNNVVGHAVAYTPAGVTHSSNVGVCTNYLGAQVPC